MKKYIGLKAGARINTWKPIANCILIFLWSQTNVDVLDHLPKKQSISDFHPSFIMSALELKSNLSPGPPSPDVEIETDEKEEDELEMLYRMKNLDSEAETDGVSRTEHETHCDSCFNLKECLREQRLLLRKSEPSASVIISCSVVSCPHGCSVRFHECKLEEHTLLCPCVKVPCLNVEYGCPFVMERWKRSSHLTRCPASVVVCTVEWNRKPLPPWETPMGLSNNSTDLDIATLLRDQKTVSQFSTGLPSHLKTLLKSTNRHPAMPLGVAGHRIPNCILKEAKLERESGESPDNNDDDEDTFSSFTAEGVRKSPEGLQESVCKQLKDLSFVPSEDPSKSDSSNLELKEKTPNAMKPKALSLMIDVISKNATKFANIYSFMCAREFRRDEYGDHFRGTHTEIVTQVNGWLFKRCPLKDYGCSFGVEHIFPNIKDGKQYKVIYNEVLGSFCYTQVETESNTQGDLESEGFNNLPFEILIRLTQYLDPLSLNALSMTSRLLREVCEYVVAQRGIVVFDWDRNPETGKWEVAAKKWLFSTSFSPIRQWSFGDVAVISNHMRNCPCFIQNQHRPEKPFSYPVKLSDL